MVEKDYIFSSYKVLGNGIYTGRGILYLFVLSFLIAACDPFDILFEPVDQNEPVTIMTDSLQVARSMHTATLLPDGRVLIAGGYNGEEYITFLTSNLNSGFLKSTEIYDPTTQSFESGPNMVMARGQHTATLMSDGTVLITGGVTNGGEITGVAERFDPETNSFSYAGSMTTPRRGHRASLLPDDRILITGGLDDVSASLTPLREIELYDNTSERFYKSPITLPAGRFHATQSMPDSTVLIIGGFQNWSVYQYTDRDRFIGYRAEIPANELIDPEINLLDDGNVLITGNLFRNPLSLPNTDVRDFPTDSTAFIYDVDSDSVYKTKRMTRIRVQHTSTKLDDGSVLITGGHSQFSALGDVEVFDPESLAFTKVGRMHSYRRLHTATRLSNGQVLIVGGSKAVEAIKSAELFDPARIE